MKKFVSIIICKFVRLIGNILGKGSSLPGKIALKICPDILSKVKLPKYIIAVTGSNGKTSTVEMIAKIFKDAGKSFSYNKEGSNQIEGVTTFILNDCTLKGKFKKDIILLETDERFAKYTFKYFTPTHYVVLNLYRDQLTRNGHPEWVYECIKESISDKTKLILNANDPLVCKLAVGHKNVVWFGVDKLPTSKDKCESIYNDYKYCPNCKAKLNYEYYHYGNIGKFNCSNCGLKTNTTDFTVTQANLKEGYIIVNKEEKINLSVSSPYTMYNTLAAYCVAKLLLISPFKIKTSLDNYILKNGRVVTFKLGEKSGTLLTSKHENSVSYDQSINIVLNDESDSSVLIIVDSISRKYFTSDVSWLWDINFEALDNNKVKKIVLSGLYCNDLAVRFEYCNINKSKISVIGDINEAVEFLKENSEGKIYVITCFSDKNKFLSKIKIDD